MLLHPTRSPCLHARTCMLPDVHFACKGRLRTTQLPPPNQYVYAHVGAAACCAMTWVRASDERGRSS